MTWQRELMGVAIIGAFGLSGGFLLGGWGLLVGMVVGAGIAAAVEAL